MIRGRVSDYLEPLVSIRIENESGEARIVRALIDTGFDGWVSLPVEVIDDLQFPWIRTGRALLADDQEVTFSIYRGHVVWDGDVQVVSIDAGGATPLVGMGLIKNYDLRIAARPGGEITLTAIT